MAGEDKAGITKAEIIRDAQTRVMYLEAHGLLTFGVDANADDETVRLGQAVGLLDKRAHRDLGVGSEQWEAVVQLLVNAIAQGLDGSRTKIGWQNYREAEKLFDHYKQLVPHNRITYLAGLGIGLLGVVILGLVVQQFSAIVDQNAPEHLFPMLCGFAALGSVASVLSRIARIDELRVETATLTLLISGASRPFVPAIFSIIIYFVLKLEIITIKIGEGVDPQILYLVAAFLCGYSERFAAEILSRISPQRSDSDER